MRRARAIAAGMLTVAVAGCGQNLQSLLPANVLATGSLAPANQSPVTPQAAALPAPAVPAPAAAAPGKAQPQTAAVAMPSPAAAAGDQPPNGTGPVATALATVSGMFAPSSTVHGEPPVEIYSRVARGILGCWFGPAGGMRRTHVFHADVAPEHKGGESDIVLHLRDEGTQSPRSLRAYRVSITRMGNGSRAVAENLKFPEAMGAAMQADVARWAHGGTGCSDAVVAKVPEAPPAQPEKSKKKAKKRAPPAKQVAAKKE